MVSDSVIWRCGVYVCNHDSFSPQSVLIGSRITTDNIQLLVWIRPFEVILYFDFLYVL